MAAKRSNPVIVQGRTYRLTARQAEESGLAGNSGSAPCGQKVDDLASHQNGCRTCLTTTGAYLPAEVREAIADEMWRASSAERLAAFAA